MALLDDVDIVEQDGSAEYGQQSLKASRIFSVQYKDSVLAYFPSQNVDPALLVLEFPDPEHPSAMIQIGDPHPYFQYSFLKCINAKPDGRGCKVELQYETPDHESKCDMNGELWEMDWGVKQQHITTALWGQTHLPEAAASMGNTIGADGEEVKGCDAQRAYGTLKVTKRLSSLPNAGTMRTYEQCINSTNSSAMMQGAIGAGEALCTGVNYIRVNKNYTLLELTFNVIPQQPAATITLYDGTEAVISYFPWQYPWYRHQGKMEIKAGGGKMRKIGIESIHVATIYPTVNFASTFNLVGPTYA